jgi:hypothetical protein
VEEKTAYRGRHGKKSMKEVEESAGLLEGDSDEDDNEIAMIMGFDPEMPISLQAYQHTAGMQNEFKKRKRARDPETCVTPPMVEDNLWTSLDDDPFGVYNSLGGRSSPQTPPPLRSLKLTYNATSEKILNALDEVKAEAFKHDNTKEVDLIEDMASHDFAIRKFKNYKTSNMDPNWYPTKKPQQHHQVPHQRPRFGNSMIMRPTMNRPCTPKCPGSFGILPSLQCVMCKLMYHAKCQGQVSPKLRVFRCRGCLMRLSTSSASRARPSQELSSSVKMRLPMAPKNGKRPMVELVVRNMDGRYQPIKFRNNSQITETIPRALFHKANQARKTLYVKSVLLPKLNGKPVFLAINPLNATQQPVQRPAQPSQPPASVSGDQVAILVRPQKAAANSKPVLLNVPRKVAMKVKVGTTLSFSASNDHKYIVMDSKIHPPVGSKQPQPKQPRLPLPPSLTVIPSQHRPGPKSRSALQNQAALANLMTNRRPGLTVTRGGASPAFGGRPVSNFGPGRPAKVARMGQRPASSVLSSGEV